jgi:hypothetical protein
VRAGVIVRAEARGLGIQTRAVADALPADRVLYVEPQPASWPQHSELFAHHKVMHVFWRRGQLHPEREVRRWLKGLDVVYTAESAYDPRLPVWCSAAGCALVRHANPEQLAPDEVDGYTTWWSATPWRLEHMPAGTRVVPMPVDRPAEFDPGFDEPRRPVRFVHSMGHFAQDDRAGTQIVAHAVKLLRSPCQLVVFCQDRRPQSPFKVAGKGVEVVVRAGGVADRWDQFRGADVLVLPRRYGGLSLPSQEAMAAGLALVMPDVSPNEVWPGPKIPTRRAWSSRMRCGPVDLHDADPVGLAEIMARLVEDRAELDKWKAESRAWAEANTWEALRPLWLDELESASSSPGRQAANTGNVPVAG